MAIHRWYAHQSSAGSSKTESQAIAKSAGGNSTKIHLIVDAHGNPLDFIISNGVTNDVKIAPVLIELMQTGLLNIKIF